MISERRSVAASKQWSAIPLLVLLLVSILTLGPQGAHGRRFRVRVLLVCRVVQVENDNWLLVVQLFQEYGLCGLWFGSVFCVCLVCL